MMTPQEVGSRSFAKATLGGYNLAQVDEFLDVLTEDYTALYNENAILKNKLKVLSDKVEEYRATEETMRKTLLAAQQMADAMMREAEAKRDALVGEAEHEVKARVDELQKAVAAEEYRLRQAQESTAVYVKKLARFHEEEMAFLSHLGELVPPELEQETPEEDPSSAIEAAVAAQVFAEEQAEEKPAPKVVAVGPDDDVPPMPDDVPLPGMDDMELDPDATRRFSDMQFGKDYKIE